MSGREGEAAATQQPALRWATTDLLALQRQHAQDTATSVNARVSSRPPAASLSKSRLG